MIRTLIVFLLLVSFASTTFSNEVLSVIYPREQGRDKASSYDFDLLKLAMSKSGVEYEISLSDIEMNEERARRMISSGSPTVTVMSAGTRTEFEEQLRPIYIPLYGGLIGHRIFIIHKDNLALFESIDSLEGLRELTAAQGHSWPDVDILENSNLVVETAEYPILFKLIERKRVDYFPRGANEPFAELERFKTEYPSLVVEPNISLVYPFALYFFVSHDNYELHQAIQRGLERAHEDGSFVGFFQNHPVTQKMIEEAHLKDRIRININNPTLSKRSLEISDRYWFNDSWLRD